MSKDVDEMNRLLEGLERLAMPDELHNEECKKAGVELTEDYDLIKEALLELKSIKEAELSDALRELEYIGETCYVEAWNAEEDCTLYAKNYIGYDTIKNYILKAQEQEKALKVIFEKKVDIYILNDLGTLEDYNEWVLKKYGTYYQLTQEEFEFIGRLVVAK